MNKLIIIHGGELAADVAQQVSLKKPSDLVIDVSIQCASVRPKSLLTHGTDTVICFVIQTIENEAPTEEVINLSVSFLILIRMNLFFS